MRLRQLARNFTNQIVSSLRNGSGTTWGVEDNCISINGVHVYVHPKRCRLFDVVEIRMGTFNVWVPLIQRLRVRRAYREFVLERSLKRE
jgi:hypothetical protein